MKVINKVLCTTIAGVALFGVSGLTAVASAQTLPPVTTVASDVALQGAQGAADSAPGNDTVITPIDPALPELQAAGMVGDDEMHAEYTRGFSVTNVSGNVLRLTSFSGNDAEDQLPTLGTVVQSGGSIRFEIAWLWARTHDVTANFDVVDPQGAVVGKYWATMRVHSMPAWTEQSSWAMVGGPGAVWGGGQEQYYGDEKDTVIELPASQAQAQADVLNRICTAGQATCTFTPTSRDENAWTGEHQIGEAWGNKRTTAYTKEFTASKNMELTQSLEIGATTKLTVAKIFEASINAKYSRGWKQSEAYSDKTTLTVQPGTMTWPVGNFPIITDTGDFTVTMGNTTWILRGVTFEHPDPTRHATITWEEAPIGSANVGAVQPIGDSASVIDTSAGF